MNTSKGPDSAEDLDFDRRTFHYTYWISGLRDNRFGGGWNW